MPATLPDAIVRVLRDPAPVASDFKPTKFTPAETKAWFATHLLRFASADFPNTTSPSGSTARSCTRSA